MSTRTVIARKEPASGWRKRRSTNVSLNEKSVEEAKRFDINVSRACEQGLMAEVARLRSQKWQEENCEAINAFNAVIDEQGILLEEHRMF